MLSTGTHDIGHHMYAAIVVCPGLEIFMDDAEQRGQPAVGKMWWRSGAVDPGSKKVPLTRAD
jgi:hypothetical protein